MSGKLKIVLSMIIWGSVGIFVKKLDLPSMEVAFLRAAIASIFLLLAGFWLGRKETLAAIKENLILLLISGAAMGLNWVMLFQSYKYTTISNSTLSYYFAPVFMLLLSPVFLKEKLTCRKLLSVAGAMTGLFIILSSQKTVLNGTYNHPLGIAFGLSAAILYASVVLLNRKMKNLTGYEMTLVQIFAASMVLLPFIIYRNNVHIPNTMNLVLILIVGLVHTGIAYLLYFSGIRDVSAQDAAILSYIDPISAIILGTLILGEALTPWHILGGLLILISTYFGQNNN